MSETLFELIPMFENFELWHAFELKGDGDVPLLLYLILYLISITCKWTGIQWRLFSGN